MHFRSIHKSCLVSCERWGFSYQKRSSLHLTYRMTVTLFKPQGSLTSCTKSKQPTKLRHCIGVNDDLNTLSEQADSQRIGKRRVALTARQKKLLQKSSVRITCDKPRLAVRVLKGGRMDMKSDQRLNSDEFWRVYHDHLERLESKR